MISEKEQNIILIGFMGCGKSTLGKEFASKFNRTFVDMDEEIEKQEGIPVSDIFAQKGEAYFRELESSVLKSFQSKTNSVISTGGGTPCFNNNMEIINRLGKSVYIKLNPETLVERLKEEKSKRPLIADLSESELLVFIQSKLDERKKYYLEANIVLEGTKANVHSLLLG